MNLLLLLIMLLFVALVAVISYKRGIIWTLIRVFFLCITSLVAYVFAEPLAKTLIVKFLGDSTAKTVPEIFEKSIKASNLAELTALKTPASGFVLSFVTPVAFSLLFLIGIIISLFLYCLAKAIIKKFCVAIILREIPLFHKITGGIIGALVGIYAFAVLLSPALVPVHIIDDTGKSDMIFRLAKHLAEINDEKSANAPSTITLSHTVDTVEDIYETVLHSPIHSIINATGSYAFSEKIYEEIATISRLTLTESNTLPENYNILTTIREIVPLLRDTDDFLDTLDKNSDYLSLPVITEAESLFNKVINITFLSSDEKLTLVNFATDRINAEIDKLEYSEYIDRLKKYNSFETFKQNMGSYFELLKYISTVDVNELINEYLGY